MLFWVHIFLSLATVSFQLIRIVIYFFVSQKKREKKFINDGFYDDVLFKLAKFDLNNASLCTVYSDMLNNVQIVHNDFFILMYYARAKKKCIIIFSTNKWRPTNAFILFCTHKKIQDFYLRHLLCNFSRLSHWYHRQWFLLFFRFTKCRCHEKWLIQKFICLLRL